MNHTTLREVSNLSVVGDAKQRLAQRINNNYILGDSYRLAASTTISRSSLYGIGYGSSVDSLREGSASPCADNYRAKDPTYCTDLVKDITAMYMEKERQVSMLSSDGQVFASPRYLTYQPEINEKMRMILIDWLIDVHLKFKLHAETMFLAVNIIDRYLSCVNTKRSSSTYVARSQLQLVGITSMLVAAKYEEIWPPEVKECVHISANTYTRDEVIKMERAVCSALSFRLTVPTALPFILRLLSVVEGLERQGSADEHAAYMTLLRHTSFFFLEHALLEYKCLQFTPSQQANAALFLALATLRIKEHGVAYSLAGETIWTRQLQHYSKAQVREFKACADVILEFVSYVPTTKYQAVRRKYSSVKYGEAAKLMMPNEVPDY